MKNSKKTLIPLLLAVSISSPLTTRAEPDCNPGGGSSNKVAQDALSSVYEPAHLIGSCATHELETRNATARIDQSIQEFFNPSRQASVQQTVFTGFKDDVFNGKSWINNDPFFEPGFQEKYKSLTQAANGKPGNHPATLELVQYSKQLDQKREAAIAERSKAMTDTILNDQGIRDRVKQKAIQKSCVNGVNISVVPSPGMQTFAYDSSKPENRDQSLAEALTAQKEDINDPDSITTCSQPFTAYSTLVDVDENKTIDLKNTGFFADNQSTLSPENEAKFKAAMAKVLKSPAPNCTTVVHSAQILTSSNWKRNTGSDVGAWDFKKLSDLRADYMQSLLNPMLQHPAQGVKSQTAVIGIDANGTNGDGTSGPCPYKATQNRENHYLIENDPSVSKEALEKAKKAEVTFDIEYVGAGCPQNKDNTAQVKQAHAYSAYKCAEVQVRCK